MLHRVWLHRRTSITPRRFRLDLRLWIVWTASPILPAMASTVVCLVPPHEPPVIMKTSPGATCQRFVSACVANRA